LEKKEKRNKSSQKLAIYPFTGASKTIGKFPKTQWQKATAGNVEINIPRQPKENKTTKRILATQIIQHMQNIVAECQSFYLTKLQNQELFVPGTVHTSMYRSSALRHLLSY
jgi:hypothetical protein